MSKVPKQISSNNSVSELIETLSKGVTPFSTTIRTSSEAKVLKIHEDQLIIGLKGGEVWVYDLRENIRTSQFPTKDSKLIGLALDISNASIVTIGKSAHIKFWTFEGLLLKKLEHKHPCQLTNIHIQEDFIYIGDIKGTISRRNSLDYQSIRAHTDKITCIESDKFLISGSHDCTIKIWDKNFKILATLTSTKFVHRVCFLPLNKLASAGSKSQFCIWDLENFALDYEIQSEENWVRCISCTPCSNYIISGTNDACVRYWNLNSIENDSYESFIAHDSSVTNICVNSNGSLVVTGSADKTVKVWQVCRSPKVRPILRGHKGNVTCLAISDDERFLFSGGEDSVICKWDVRENKILTQMIEHRLTVTALATRGEEVFSISEDKRFLVWQGETVIHDVKFHEFLVTFCMTFDKFFIGGRNGNIYVLNSIYTVLHSFQAHFSTISSMVFKENLLYSGSLDHNIKVWDMDTYELKSTYVGHKASVKKLCWLPTGQLVSISCDKSVKIWFLGNPPLALDLLEHEYSITSLCINSNGWYTMTGDANGEMIIWCNSELTSMVKVKFSQAITDIISFKTFPLVALATADEIHLNSDLLAKNQLMTIPNTQSYLFFLYISSLLKGKIVPLKHMFKDYFIIPLRLNLLHILAYTNDYQGMREAMQNNVKFFSSDGENPLRIALDQRSYQTADVILKYVPIYRENSCPFIYKILEAEIVDLIPLPLNNLAELIRDAYRTAKCIGLPKYGEISGTTITASDKIIINPEDFKIKAGGRDALEYHVCTFKLPLEPGSSDCMKLLKNILECENPEIFDTCLIQHILMYLMKKTYFFILAISIVDAISIISLLLYFLFFSNSILFSAYVLSINSFYLFTECLQVFQSFEDYCSDLWNIVDGLRIFTGFATVLLMLFGCDSGLITKLQSLAIFFSMIRMVSVFRLYPGTRYMIRMIFEVALDLTSFLLVLLMTTLTMAVSLYFSQKEKSTFSSMLMQSYLMNFGQIDEGGFTENLYEHVIFLIALFLNPLVMMNLLIATMGDTYSRVQSNVVVSNYKEIASFTLEACIIMFWKRKNNEKKFLQSCCKVQPTMLTDTTLIKLNKMKLNLDKLLQNALESSTKLDEALKFLRKK